MRSGWGQFIARAAVRKVVYVVVGLALAAVIGATGVDAVEQGGALDQPGVEGSAGGTAVQFHTAPFDPVGQVIVVLTSGWDGASQVGVWCATGGFLGFDTPSATTFTWGTPGSTSFAGCRVYLYNNSPRAVVGTYSYDDGEEEPEPTPTPGPSGDPMCDPFCTVALVDEDRERLDNTFELVKYATALVAFLGSGLLVAAGLRR